MQITGNAAIITGGASGLGAATTAHLANLGARVAIFDTNKELGEAHASSTGALFFKIDITDESAVQAALVEAEKVNGKARILVNCAGIGPPGKVIDREGTALPLKEFVRIINVNLVGTFNVLSKFAARLHRADSLGEERGVIVNTASVAAYEGQIGQPAYSASKGGIVSMTLPIARELARFGIRVMTIAPGIFWTPLLASFSREVQESLGKQVPFPSRLGKPEEYALLAESIICNPMLNGTTIRLDGAIRMAGK